MQDAVIISNISKIYKSGKESIHALDNVTLTIKEGEIFGLLGPNGAGKTTLISMLIGILKQDSGSISILGMDVARETSKIQNNINVVSGFSRSLISLSVEECLIYYCMLYNVKNPKAKVDRLLKKMGLYEARNLLAEDLSSGMRQKYLICKGLLNDPKILLLDEPTVGLDVESAILVRKMIKELKGNGMTILLTTHNMFEAEELCDNIAFINRGKIVSIGTPKELKSKIMSTRTVEIHCSDESCVLSSLKSLPGVKAKVKSPQIVHVNVTDYKKMKDIMLVLSSCKGEIYSVNELEPTFEEIYIKMINQSQGDSHE